MRPLFLAYRFYFSILSSWDGRWCASCDDARDTISSTLNANHRTACFPECDVGIFVFDFETPLQSIFVSSAFHFERLQCNTRFSDAAAAAVVDGCTKANKEKRWNVKRMWRKKHRLAFTQNVRSDSSIERSMNANIAFFRSFLICKLCSAHAEIGWRYWRHSHMTHQRNSFFVLLHRMMRHEMRGGRIGVFREFFATAVWLVRAPSVAPLLHRCSWRNDNDLLYVNANDFPGAFFLRALSHSG